MTLKEKELQVKKLQKQFLDLQFLTTSPENDEITVYYWPMRNRGNFIRLVLVEAGIKFNDCMDETKFKPLMRYYHLSPTNEEFPSKLDVFIRVDIKPTGFCLCDVYILVLHLQTSVWRFNFCYFYTSIAL